MSQPQKDPAQKTHRRDVGNFGSRFWLDLMPQSKHLWCGFSKATQRLFTAPHKTSEEFFLLQHLGFEYLWIFSSNFLPGRWLQRSKPQRPAAGHSLHNVVIAVPAFATKIPRNDSLQGLENRIPIDSSINNIIQGKLMINPNCCRFEEYTFGSDLLLLPLAALLRCSDHIADCNNVLQRTRKRERERDEQIVWSCLVPESRPFLDSKFSQKRMKWWNEYCRFPSTSLDVNVANVQLQSKVASVEQQLQSRRPLLLLFARSKNWNTTRRWRRKEWKYVKCLGNHMVTSRRAGQFETDWSVKSEQI